MVNELTRENKSYHLVLIRQCTMSYPRQQGNFFFILKVALESSVECLSREPLLIKFYAHEKKSGKQTNILHANTSSSLIG